MSAPPPPEGAGALHARTLPGLHASLLGVLARWAPPPGPVLDLGAGTGAWAARLLARGYQVSAAERERAGFQLAGVECLALDLDERFAPAFGGRTFGAITAVEVIEHLENPRAFLRECRGLLAEEGVLLLTTPNIENVAARLRFLATGELRLFGRDPSLNDPTHITPIHSYMLEKMLRDTRLELVEHTFNQPRPQVTRPLFRALTAAVEPWLRGLKVGDCHIFVIRKAG